MRPTTRRLPRIVALAVVLVLASAGHTRAGDPAPAVDLAAPRAALVKDLEALAATAGTQRLQKFRDGVYRALLVVAPEHAAARAGLKFKKDAKTGAWKQAPDYKEGVDWTPAALPAAKTKLATILGTYRDAVFQALGSVENLADGDKEEHLDALAALLPDDAQIHQVRGDVEADGRWVMPESVKAGPVRERFHKAALAGDALARTIRPTPTLPSAFEGSGFQDGRALHKVFGWTGEKWAQESLRFLVIGRVLATEVLASDLAKQAGPKETLMFPTVEATKAWMVKNPTRATASDLRDVDAVGALSTEDGTRLVYFEAEGLRRTTLLYTTLEDAITYCCPDGAKGERAWVTQGLACRMLRFVTTMRPPTRVTLEGTGRPKDARGEKDFPDDMGEWSAAAAAALADHGAERLARVLTIQLTAMEPADVLVSYGLAAYVREGRPDKFRAFVDASRKGDDPAAVVRTVLATDLRALASRTRRWLLEQPE